MMVRLVHKPTEVDAVLWDDQFDTRAELVALGYVDDNGDFVYENPGAPIGTRTLVVPTMEGPRSALPGESWVIRGVVGEWYSIRSDVKAAAYHETAS